MLLLLIYVWWLVRATFTVHLFFIRATLSIRVANL
jgi:hypothetical protein